MDDIKTKVMAGIGILFIMVILVGVITGPSEPIKSSPVEHVYPGGMIFEGINNTDICPECNSSNITQVSLSVKNGYSYEDVKCNNCKVKYMIKGDA
jgi:rubredoxin